MYKNTVKDLLITKAFYNVGRSILLHYVCTLVVHIYVLFLRVILIFSYPNIDLNGCKICM